MMTAFKRLGTMCAAGMTLFAAASPALAGPELAYHFKPDQALKYRMTTDVDANTTMPGMGEMKQTIHMVMDTSMNVQKVEEDGTASIEVKYTAVKMDIDSGMMGKMSYDSSKKDEGEGSPLAEVGKMIDKPFVIVMEKSGKVREVKGLADIMPANPMMEQMFSDEQMRATFQQAFYFLPDSPSAKEGDTWSRSYEQGPMKFTNDYTLKSLGESEATINAKTNVSLTSEEMMGMKVKMEDGKGDGVITFDTAAGMLKAFEGQSTFTMQMSGPQGEIKQKATSKIKTTKID